MSPPLLAVHPELRDVVVPEAVGRLQVDLPEPDEVVRRCRRRVVAGLTRAERRLRLHQHRRRRRKLRRLRELRLRQLVERDHRIDRQLVAAWRQHCQLGPRLIRRGPHLVVLLHSIARFDPGRASGDEAGDFDRFAVQIQTQRTVGLNNRLQPAFVRIVDELLSHGFVEPQRARMIRRKDRDAIASRHVPVAVAELVKHPFVMVPLS